MLRGVNLGGSSKVPSNRKAGPEALKDPASVSFVGRPFPLEEAEDHFDKLKSWGLTFIRLVVTWEAIEHAGPGIYDEAYLDYLEGVLLAAEKKGISILIDPHQDVWSRWTGGDGAPAWTLEKLGFDLDRLDAAGAAITEQGYSENHNGKPYPQMRWPVNYSLYAAATMFSVFFGSNVFAPKLSIEGKSAQDYLQEKYVNAFCRCFARLRHCKAISAWGVMNEPHPGFIGYAELNRLEDPTLAVGPVPNPFQAMMAASGIPVKVPVYIPWIKGWKAVGKEVINPKGLSLFKDGFSCPWEQAGVWVREGDGSSGGASGRLLNSKYFSACRNRPIRFTDDFLRPLAIRFMDKMEKAGRSALFFIEGVPHGENPHWYKKDPRNAVNAFHHYDGFTLFSKKFRPYFTADNKTGRLFFGKKKTAAHYSAKLDAGKNWSLMHMGDIPCFLGEFGLPFDLDSRKAYKTGDYSLHEKALSLYYDGIDDNLLGSTIWNYTADNTNESGDHWNGEDLSIVSGGKPRAEGGWLRPYPMATAGLPTHFSWDRENVAFCLKFRADPEIEAPTEIFVPSKWFTGNLHISVKATRQGGGFRTGYLREEQLFFIFNDGYEGEVELNVSVRSAASEG